MYCNEAKGAIMSSSNEQKEDFLAAKSISRSPNSEYLAVPCEGGNVQIHKETYLEEKNIYEYKKEAVQKHKNGSVNSVSWSPDSKYIVLGGKENDSPMRFR